MRNDGNGVRLGRTVNHSSVVIDDAMTGYYGVGGSL